MIAVTGATGFIGRAVCRELELRGLTVRRIGRGAGADITWPSGGNDFSAEGIRRLQGVRAVVHLAGSPISVRWTAARKRAIRDSRVGLTATLSRALAAVSPRPRALIAASAVGIYGDRGDEWLDESSAPGTDFLAGVAVDWEAAADPAREAGIRVVHMRTGIVLGHGGGIIGKLTLPFLLGGGAALGRGDQWMSWISLDDVTHFVLRAIDDEALSGPVNLVAPEPVRNGAFTSALARALRRPALLSIPAPVLTLAFGEMARGALLASQRVRPGVLLAARFPFAHPALPGAIEAAVET